MFTKIQELIPEGADLHISIKNEGGRLTVATFMKGISKDITLRTPLILSGTAAEMDAEYLDAISKPVKAITAKFTSNADALVKEVDDKATAAEEKTRKENEERAKKASKATTSKEPSAKEKKAELKKKVDEAIEAGAVLFKQQNYTGALAKYQEAQTLDPENKYVKADIAKCEQWIAAEKDLFSSTIAAPVAKEMATIGEVIAEVAKTETVNAIDEREEEEEEIIDNAEEVAESNEPPDNALNFNLID